MKKYSIQIANLFYLVQSEDDSVFFAPEPGYEHFLTENQKSNVVVKVQCGTPDISDFEKVFDVPEDASGQKLWTIYKKNEIYCIVCKQQNIYGREIQAFFDSTFCKWNLFIRNERQEKLIIDPLAYPLGPIIMLYATQMHDGIVLHASGVEYKNKGLVFCGFSGKGKTTISNIFARAGATLINDDRLIIRKIDNRFKVFNTPMHYPDKPKEMTPNSIFIIEHSSEHKFKPLTGISAVANISAMCIQHHFASVLLSNQLQTITELEKNILAGKLGFSPDKSIICFIEKLFK